MAGYLTITSVSTLSPSSDIVHLYVNTIMERRQNLNKKGSYCSSLHCIKPLRIRSSTWPRYDCDSVDFDCSLSDDISLECRLAEIGFQQNGNSCRMCVSAQCLLVPGFQEPSSAQGLFFKSAAERTQRNQSADRDSQRQPRKGTNLCPWSMFGPSGQAGQSW